MRPVSARRSGGGDIALRPAARRTLPRREPAPSRLRYRLTRLWLRPGVRRLVHVGLPVTAALLGGWTLLSELDVEARAMAAIDGLRDVVLDQPQVTITRMEVPEVSDDLAEQIRVAAFVTLPVSSLELNVAAVRDRVEALDAVERARVRALARGVLEIRAIERVPVIVWRSPTGLQLLDRTGVRVAEIDSRLRRPDLPLIAGDGAGAHVAEALALIGQAGPVGPRIRGLVRRGARRWDLVLDRDQVIRLPEDNPGAALARVMVLQARDQALDRDLTIVDMRNPDRPMLRLTGHAVSELERLRELVSGEDA